MLYNIFYVQNSGHLLRITVLGIRFKIKHKYFAKPARYGYKKIAALEEGNKIITDHIKSGKPFALGRFGWSELNIIHSYYRQRNKKNIHFNPDHIDVIKYNAGFFSADTESLIRYSKEFLNFTLNFDIICPCLFYFNHEETIINYYASDSVKLAYSTCIAQEMFTLENPWTQALEGKKVLVIHPFKQTILQQIPKRHLLFKNPKLAPNCEIKVIQAVQGIDVKNASKLYKDWYEGLQSMYNSIDQEDFDIAIIGAGAYGMFLTNYIKSKGKQAIYMAGATQLLFGIKGTRWDRYNFYNEHWTNVLKEETPQNLNNFIKAEFNKAYW